VNGKDCTLCGEFKELDEFYTRRSGSSSGRTSWCKACYRKQSREYFARRKKEDPEGFAKRRAEAARRRRADPAKRASDREIVYALADAHRAFANDHPDAFAPYLAKARAARGLKP